MSKSNRIVTFFAKVLSPAVGLGYYAVGLVLLAVAPAGNKRALLLALLWAGVLMALLYAGIYGSLYLSRKRGDDPVLRVLVRVTEITLLVLSLAAAGVAVWLYDVPMAASLLPVSLFGLGGALRFDARYLLGTLER